MDDYFNTVDSSTPRTEDGELDLESPLCLDMDLLNKHFTQLARGERVYIFDDIKYNENGLPFHFIGAGRCIAEYDIDGTKILEPV